MANQEVYEKITSTIIASLEKGVIPWRKTWNGGVFQLPKNMVSKRLYTGINTWVLGMQCFNSPFWGTYNQISALGGFVRKGEKGSPIMFYSSFEKVNKETGEKEKVFVAKAWTVFNAEQCDGLNLPVAEKVESTKNENGTISECENIISGYVNAPSISFGGNKAFYRPSTDSVRMPELKIFENSESYYSTFFHELTHSTGAKKRLDRLDNATFGSHSYSKEELVAEMGASFLCAHSGIVNDSLIENSTAYIASWLKVLKGDVKFVIQGASQAQKAINVILGKLEDPE